MNKLVYKLLLCCSLLLSACQSNHTISTVLQQVRDKLPETLTSSEQASHNGQLISEIKALEHVSIKVRYQGGVLYHIKVSNDLSQKIELLWDRSSYLTTAGRSVRLLYLPSAQVPEFAPGQQDDSQILPKARFEAEFTGDDWIDCARRNCTPQAQNSLETAKIFLAFKINDKVQHWQGEVSFNEP